MTYITYINQDSMVLQTDRHTGLWTRTEGPEIASYKYGQLVFDRNAKAIQWKESFSANDAGTTGHPQAKPLTQNG